MLKIGKESKLTPGEAVKKAIEFFGPKGYGLELTEEGDYYVTFTGAGGGVQVSATPSKKGSSIDVESVEWDYQAKQFLEKIK
jgi:hypothetical protein